MGIDLGTTNSCIYLWNPDTQDAEVILNLDGDRTCPSWVAYGRSGADEERPVGKTANGKKNWCYDVKRIIGKSWDSLTTNSKGKKDRKLFRELQRMLPYTITKSDDGMVDVNCFNFNEQTDFHKDREQHHNIKYKPEQLSAEVLGFVKKAAEARCQRPVTEAVITVPAYFENPQKEATKEAASLAGFNVIRNLAEPIAAAVAGGFHKTKDPEEEKNVLVFDFGGGTFDVSVLHIEENVLDVEATKGDSRLGGRDIDEVILQKCI